jgi:hypothetical protein
VYKKISFPDEPQARRLSLTTISQKKKTLNVVTEHSKTTRTLTLNK